MGVLKELVLLPIAPLRFTVWVADQVAQEADRRQFSAPAVMQQLDELEQARERGELDEDRAAQLEGELLQQQASRARRAAGEEEASHDG